MSAKQLYSVNIADRYEDSEGAEKTNFRQIALGFSNKKGGLSFRIPKGVLIGHEADIVIFPIERED